MRLGPVQWAWLRQAVSDRVDRHKPLQYIIGDQPFGNAKIGIRPPVLIPRWETEEWVLRLTNMIKEQQDTCRTGQLPAHMKILDACTGSGCIALGLACELPANSACVTGVDISPDAIALARDNLERNTHSLKNTVNFHRVDLQSPKALYDLREMETQWHMLVSNPPYVTAAEYEQLEPDVRDWEDVRALLARLAKDLGLSKVHSDGPLAATNFPRLVIEIGGTKQVEPVRQAMHDNGFNLTEVWKDMADTDRVVLGYAKK
ncbi:S-adenosyl-L-methionine-dependent methyltransferase [Coemansia reversa NRRL 1564]|uniref:peptide chain release factor N(5)-glutamine methyltransferase n=1 Tax=Coemansia reversa (strain ATCC 12441 / NRRL 1564) TaxID=763665 RepID=A0A2G5B9Z4_COERN|nr:S-adenosyl-L-methionine-dependent methyltransferase [Coemansia reversa NRRL 1564]|eukprot:PIA15810.1 S-adenosyl-L-methionine-dependent methyltransferase [Coemansia reversa NRRL 1564]